MSQIFNHGYALLIGVGEIAEYPKWSLPVTVRDVMALRGLLTMPGRCAYPDNTAHVRLLHDRGATHHAILNGLAWLRACAAKDPAATVVVYYSGHGWLDQQTNRYYLIPHDVDPFDVSGSALAAHVFHDALRTIPARRLLVLIDSCHAEGMATAKEAAMGGITKMSMDATKVKLPHGFAKQAPPDALLDALQQGEGRAVFSSSRGDQSSWIRPDGTLSIFTHHLLEALQGAANQPGEQAVRLSHLMNHLARAVPASVRQLVNAEQRPFVNLASEDFPVALLWGGKGLPAGSWSGVEGEAQQTIAGLPLLHVEGDRNVSGDVRGGPVQTGDYAVATGSDLIHGDKREIRADFYYEQVTISVVDETPPDAVRSEYLKRLRNRCLVLPMAAIGGEEGVGDAVRLDQLYVELDTLSPALGQNVSGQSAFPGDYVTVESDKRLPVMAAATAERHLVLLGDPGSGKSTFVRQLLAWLAAAGLGETGPPGGWSADMLPLLTNLRDLAPRLAELALDGLSTDMRHQQIVAALRAQWEADLAALATPVEPALAMFEAALTEGAVLVVFDGLDEVPERVRIRIGWMLDALLAAYPAIAHVILTCRARSYAGDAVLPAFGAHRLAPFDEVKIERFIAGWYRAQVDLQRLTESAAETRRKDLVRAALSAELSELAANPMLLTTMAIIHQREVGLPKERVRLYHQAVALLLHRWQHHRGVEVSAELAAILADELKMRTIMERLAYEAHRREVNDEGRLRLGVLMELLSEPDYLGDVGLAGEFLNYVDEKAGVLVGEGGSEGADQPVTYAFPHRTFREYLTGCYLIGGRPSARRLRPYAAGNDFWYLAAQLAGEELFYNRRNDPVLLDLMYELCPTTPASLERDWRTALWSGHMATLLGSEEIAKDTEPGGGCTYLARLQQRMAAIVGDGLLTSSERIDAGQILSVLGDTRPGVGVIDGVPDILWCAVPGGVFAMGADDLSDDERPLHQLEIDAFRIAKYPITNTQYAAFVTDTGSRTPDHWPGAVPPRVLKNHPVVNVTWHEAVAFCTWLSEKLGHAVRLPSEAEWEKAAKGSLGNRRYPWGSAGPDAERCNFNMQVGETTSVGIYPLGQSLYQCCDMSGNVWEWTSSLWGAGLTNAAFCYPYDPSDGRETLTALEGMHYVLRGGAYVNDQTIVRCAYRGDGDPYGKSSIIGFRVAVA